MKQIRQVSIVLILALGIFSALAYLGCKKSKCGSTTCQNGGTCDNNACVCPAGYSGNSCQTGWSDEFVGTYKCKRGTCVPAVTDTTQWLSSITKDVTNSGFTVDISNFNNAGAYSIAATVDSIGGIAITPAAGVSGTHATGYYIHAIPGQHDTIKVNYTTASAVGTTFSCSMIMVKQ